MTDAITPSRKAGGSLPYKDLAITLLSLCLSLLSFEGCIRAGGGGVSMIEPKEIDCHKPVKVGIRCVSYEGNKATARNHTNVRLFFIRPPSAIPQVVESYETKEDAQGVSFYAEIPPYEPDKDCPQVEYWFEWLWDGIPNSTDKSVIPSPQDQ